MARYAPTKTQIKLSTVVAQLGHKSTLLTRVQVWSAALSTRPEKKQNQMLYVS